MNKTILKNPVELRMHWTRKLLPLPAKSRIDSLADSLANQIKLPPIYIVEPNLVVAGWTRTLAHRQMQQDIECIAVSEEQATTIALGENTNRQGYSFSYQVAWVYMPLALKTLEFARQSQLQNLRQMANAAPRVQDARSELVPTTMEAIADRIGVSRRLLFDVKSAYENIIEWDAKHEPVCWGDSKEKQTALDYCNARILDPEAPCTPGNAWAGVAGKQAAHEGKTKPAPKQLELFCDGMAAVAKWGKQFDKFEADARAKAVKAIRRTVAEWPPTLREEIGAEIKRLAREAKEAQA